MNLKLFTKDFNFMNSQRSIHLIIISLFCIFLLFSLVTEYPSNGDTYLYATSMHTLKGPIVHLGYYLFCGFIKIIFALFNINDIILLGFISAFMGTICIIFFYFILNKLFTNSYLSFIGSLILLGSGDFWFFSMHGEVYIPQLTLVVFSIFLVLYDFSFSASIVFLFALTITPTSILALPGLLYLHKYLGYDKKKILCFIMPIMVTSVIILIFYYNKIYIILSDAIFSPFLFTDNHSIFSLAKRVIIDTIRVYIKSFHVFLLFLVYGVIRIYKQKYSIFILLLFFIIPFSLYFFNIGLISGDHLILTFIPISVFISYGIFQLLDKLNIKVYSKNISLLLLILVYGWLSYQLHIGPEKLTVDESKSHIEILKSHLDVNDIIICPYNYGMNIWYHIYGPEDITIDIGRPDQYFENRIAHSENIDRLDSTFWINVEHFVDFKNINHLYKLVRNRNIYFIDKIPHHYWLVNTFVPETFYDTHNRYISSYSKFFNFFKKESSIKITSQNIFKTSHYLIYKINVKI